MSFNKLTIMKIVNAILILVYFFVNIVQQKKEKYPAKVKLLKDFLRKSWIKLIS